MANIREQLANIAEVLRKSSEDFDSNMAKFAKINVEKGSMGGVFSDQGKEANYKALESANDEFSKIIARVGKELSDTHGLDRMSTEQLDAVLTEVKQSINIFSAA